MDQVIETIIEKINSETSWSLNEKIRYAYVALGKRIHLNVEFFYSLYNLMNGKGYTVDELMEIYESDANTDSVMCRDSARMLKRIFDACGIECEIRRTCEIDDYQLPSGNISIQHFFNVVTGENGKKYFLSMNLDLPYIQMGMKTAHFGNNIAYISDKNEQIYEGERVDNSVFTEDEIRELDEGIGYLSYTTDEGTTYFNESLNLLASANRKYGEYLQQMSLSMDNYFYSNIVKLFGDDSDEALNFKLSDINYLTVNNIKRKIAFIIIRSLNNFGKFNYEEGEIAALKNSIEELEYDKFLKQLEFFIRTKMDDNGRNDMFNPMALPTNLKKLFGVLDEICDLDYTNYDAVYTCKQKFNNYIFNLSRLYIEDKYKPTNNGKSFSTEYIAKKIEVLFPEIFDFGYTTDFILMNVAEKNVIIDRILNQIFPELSMDETVDRLVENPIENRIKSYMIYDNYEEKYKLLFLIAGASSENKIAYVYDYNEGANYLEKNVSVLSMLADTDRYIFFTHSLGINAEALDRNQPTR